ncbi:MAG: histidinol-phosphatase [Atopobiaceae bacterium]|nr:histidinol-phosphatase [Atopobiaceae bacterium]
MLRANYHTHSTFCDGNNTAEEMLLSALDKGFEHLGFSGHMDSDIHMVWSDYVAEVERLKGVYGSRIDIILGVELDTLYDPACCPGAEYVIGSTHYIPMSDGYFSVDHTPQIIQDGCREHFGGDWYALARAYYETEAKAVENTKCDFIGHFDLVTRFNDQLHFLDELDPRYLDPALECMEYLASTGTPFEINCGAINRGRKAEPYPRPELLRALRGFGGEIFINSDAHDAPLVDGCFDVAISRAIDAGFTHVNIFAHDPFGKLERRQLALDTLL